MKIIKSCLQFLVFLVLGIFLWSHFMKNSIDFYSENSPKMDIKEYFNGPIKAWGIIQDWRGRVVRQFDVTMVGKWENDTGILQEYFSFYDGQTQERTWTIKKLEDQKYEGTASDIIGKAQGVVNGNSAQWSYIMDLEMDDKTYRVHFDDWMWLMNDGVLVNRSYIKKFGITVAELTIFMKKD